MNIKLFGVTKVFIIISIGAVTSGMLVYLPGNLQAKDLDQRAILSRNFEIIPPELPMQTARSDSPEPSAKSSESTATQPDSAGATSQSSIDNSQSKAEKTESKKSKPNANRKNAGSLPENIPSANNTPGMDARKLQSENNKNTAETTSADNKNAAEIKAPVEQAPTNASDNPQSNPPVNTTDRTAEKKADTKAEAEKPDADAQDQDPSATYKDAVELTKSGADAEALAKFEWIIQKGQSIEQKLLASALSQAAVIRNRGHSYKEAETYLDRAIAINKTLKNARARSVDMLFMGRVLMAQARYSEALKYFEEGIRLLPASEAAEAPNAYKNAALCHLRNQSPNEALSMYQKALSGYGKLGSELEVAAIHNEMGELLISKSDTKGAGAAFKKAEKIYRDQNKAKELSETLFRIAYLDQLSGDVCSAQKAIEQGQAAYGGADSSDALPLMVKGMAAQNEGKIALAVKYLNDALTQYQKSSDRQMIPRVRLSLSNVELERARFTPALELAGRSLEEFRSLGAASGEAGALQVIADVYFRQGFVQKSLEYANESVNLARKTGAKNRLIISDILLSDIYTGMGDSESAAKALKEAIAEAKQTGNHRLRAQLKLALARFRLSRESLDKALHDAVDARKDFAELNDKRGLADSEHIMGLIYELRGESDKAHTLLQQALTQHSALWDRFSEGRGLTALGVHYKNAGDYDKALEYFQKAVDLRKGIGDLRGYAATLANIGNLLRHKNRISESSKNLEQALTIYREVLDKKGEADILTNLANVEAARGQQSSALEKYTSAMNIHKETQDSRGIATDMVGMGKIYLTRGDLAKAAECLDEAENANKRIHNPKGDIAILSELSMLQRAKGAHKQSIATLERALELAKKSKDAQAVSSLNLKMAVLFEDSGNYPKAAALLNETLETMRNLGDKKGELWALGGIGIIQAKQEDYENALVNLQKASKLRNELGIAPNQTRDLDFYMGEIYEGFREYERALEHYQKALVDAQSPGNDVGAGRIYDRIADIYYKMEEYPKAKDFYEDALRVHIELKNIQKQKVELVRIGDILSKQGEMESALKFQQRALGLATDTQDTRMQGRVLSRIGTLNQVLGRPKQALENYREAQDIRTGLGDKRGVSENLLQIALVTSNLGDFDSAVADLKKAFEIAHCSEDRGVLWKAYFIMGRALENKNKLGEALESYRKAIAVLESMEADIIEESDEDDFIFGGRSALFDTALRVLMKLARRDPQGAYDNQALRIVEKLKAAEFENTLSRINVDNFSDLPQELLIKEKSLRFNLHKLNIRISEELSKGAPGKAGLQKLLDERRSREKVFHALKEKLLKDYPDYAELRYPKPVSVHHLQKNVLDPDEAVLEYIVTRSKTYIFAIDKHRFYTFSAEYSGKDLERDVDSLTRPLQRADTLASWDPSISYKIYSKLVHPIEAFLIGKKAVVIIPHGPLSRLPFEILVDSKSHANKRFWSANDKPSYLVEKYAFCYLPSLSALNQLRLRDKKSRPGWNLVAFGDAVYQDPDKKRELNPGAEKIVAALAGASKNNRNQELKPLPGARREITEIVKIVGGSTQTYFGKEATETLFKKVDLSRYNYIHLATHGVLLSGSGKAQQQPAVVFSLFGDTDNDGFLQMGEVFGLNLNADLVVLSSCQIPTRTAQGEGGSPFGLARAFLFTGAESVMMSMWQINDDNAARLFVDVYRNLKEFSKAESLQKAKLNQLGATGTSHPYYWAPVVLVGDWRVKATQTPYKPGVEESGFKGVSSWRKFLSM